MNLHDFFSVNFVDQRDGGSDLKTEPDGMKHTRDALKSQAKKIKPLQRKNQDAQNLYETLQIQEHFLWVERVLKA